MMYIYIYIYIYYIYIYTVHIYVPCSERPLVHTDSIGSLVKQAEDNKEEEEEVRIVKMEIH